MLIDNNDVKEILVFSTKVTSKIVENDIKNYLCVNLNKN